VLRDDFVVVRVGDEIGDDIEHCDTSFSCNRTRLCGPRIASARRDNHRLWLQHHRERHAVRCGNGWATLGSSVDVDKIESLEGPAMISALLELRLAYAE
jgi:hypothetical protein